MDGSWAGFLVDLGPKLGAKLEPSWDGNPKNGGLQDDVKKMCCTKRAHVYAHVCRPGRGGPL